jgi:NADH:ubiquinone oxidoreductase subunit F (NADH-binding)
MSMAEPDGIRRLLAGVHADGTALSLDEHLGLYGPALPDARPRHLRHELIELTAASGLRGRGGAGFPTGTKLEAVASARGRAIVVANGVEGEPASRKDKRLLRFAPHLVVDGAAVAAAAVGAEEAIIAVGRGAQNELRAVAAAVAERRARRLDRPVRIRTVAVPDRFVAGEETALVNWLNSGPAKPTFVPPRPFERGVGGSPTLVQNVETLAHLALIARFGAEWFRRVGTADEPGTALVTLSGAVQRPGVYEIAIGTTMEALVKAAGGPADTISAFLFGGYFGSWLPASAAWSLPLADAALQQAGASLGARTLVVLPESACGLRESARAIRYLADESAGQCGPCVHGLAAVAAGMALLARGDNRTGARERMPRWLAQVRGRGACRHPDGAARFVESALDVFADEITRHERYRQCSARKAPPVLPIPKRVAVEWR